MHNSIKQEFSALFQRMIAILSAEAISDVCLTLIGNAVRIYATAEHNRNLEAARIFQSDQRYLDGLGKSMGLLDTTVQQALTTARLNIEQARIQRDIPPPAPPSGGVVIPFSRPKKT